MPHIGVFHLVSVHSVSIYTIFFICILVSHRGLMGLWPVHGDARFLSFGYFVLSWFVLLTELGLFIIIIINS